MRILITGATGYLGSHLARRLAREHEVFAAVREPVNTQYLFDLCDSITLLTVDDSYQSVSQAIETCKPDLIYHLAAYYTGKHGDTETPKLIQSNVVFGAYLLEAMAEHGCGALVYATSVFEHYGGEAYRPLNLYAATKRAFSDLLAYYTDAGMLRACTLVLSDTYGPDDQRPKILNLIQKNAQNGTPMDLSAGTQDYDLVHVDDVVNAFVLAGEQLVSKPSWTNERFQIVSQAPLSLRETVEKMLSLNGLTLDAHWGANPSAAREIGKAIRLYPPVPGWKQEIPLDVGLLCFHTDSNQ